MNEDKKKVLNDILNNTDFPVIIEDIYTQIFEDAITIDASSSIRNFTDSPSWLKNIDKKKYLIIRNIDYIYKEEQLKLIELLKYHKVGTNSLGNLRIILTVDKMNFDYISDEIISLTVQVR